MKKLLLYFFSVLISLGVLSSCSKNEEDKKEETESTKEETIEEVEKVTFEFFDALFLEDFKACKDRATKASYSSLNFLSKNTDEFEGMYFQEVVSCEVTDNKATCLCEFVYYGQEPIEKEISLDKFEDEWLIDFRLGKSIDNIFMYDYGYSINTRVEDVEQLPFNTEVTKELKKVVDRIKSSSVKLGFSYSSDITKVDSLYDGSSIYGVSEWISSDFVITTTYDFEDERLSFCTVEITNNDYNVDMDQYVVAMGELLKDKLGKPFNVPNEFLDKLSEIYELRWFVKGYNEMLTLRVASGYFVITLFEIP